MKPQLLKVTNHTAYSSLSIQQDIAINDYKPHYHAEVELIYVKSGEGVQFIGDSIQRFQAGDIIIIGSYLPHHWKFDNKISKVDTETFPDVSVVHFSEDIWGDQFINLPENILLKTLLENVKRGVKINNNCIIHLFDNLLKSEGTKRILLLLEILSIAAQSDYEQLSSAYFQNDVTDNYKNQIDAVYKYSLNNFKESITLKKIAEVANVSPYSFCRFFKSKTHKTYTQFLNEIRVAHACKLLVEEDINVKRICYESGFNNFASFHKYFKSITGMSPLKYQTAFLSILNPSHR